MKAYVGVDTADGIDKSGVQVSVRPKRKSEKIAQRKDRCEETGLNGAADEAVDDGVCSAEPCPRATENDC